MMKASNITEKNHSPGLLVFRRELEINRGSFAHAKSVVKRDYKQKYLDSRKS